MSLIIYEMHVDIAIVCATRISWCVSSSRKSEVRISDPAVLDHTCTFLNIYVLVYGATDLILNPNDDPL